MTTMALQYPAIPGAPAMGAPAYGAAPTAPLPPPPQAPAPRPPAPPTPRGRGPRWIVATAGVAAALAIGIGGGIAIGHTIAPAPVTNTVEVTAEPTPSPFTDADAAWCREYNATSTRLADAGEAAGAPRSMAAPDLPATAWTVEEAAANRRFADYSDTWTPGLAKLRESAENPTLKLLVEGSDQASTTLADKIRAGTYVPADYALYRTVTGTSNALLAICERVK